MSKEDTENKVDHEDNNPLQKENEKKAEEELRRLVIQVTETNKKLDDTYDETLRRVELKKKLVPENEKEEEEHITTVQVAREMYAELRAKISNARRDGKDPIIADFLSRTIPSKIKMFEATKEKIDFENIKRDIKRVEEELEEALHEENINVKKEIEQKLKLDLQKETGKVFDDE